MLQPFMVTQNIKLGRDGFFKLMKLHGMQIRKHRNVIRTTNSYHHFRKYNNLIRELEITHPNYVWVTDITYVNVGKGFKYLWLITDAYSRKIVGYNLSDTLEAKHGIEALQKAINELKDPPNDLIHHSDRGIQYCSNTYTSLLKSSGIKISMTQNGDPLENAIAERINGIIKQEFLYQIQDESMSIKKRLDTGVNTYNRHRPHMSTNMLTPEQAHQTSGVLKRKWKNYYKQPVNLLQE
jgi:putative transposase